MKLIILLLLSSIGIYITNTKVYICNSSDVKDKNGRIVQYHEHTSISIDTIKHSVSIPQYGVFYLYDKDHVNELRGIEMYVNKEYGEFALSTDLSYATFSFYNGGDVTYEFFNLKKK